jgi:hypothetical protein
MGNTKENIGDVNEAELLEEFFLSRAEDYINGTPRSAEYRMRDFERRKAAMNLETAVKLNSGLPEQLLEGLHSLLDALRVLDTFPTPSLRLEIAQGITELFNSINNHQFDSKLIDLLGDADPTVELSQLHYEILASVCDFLYYYLPGPRIHGLLPGNPWYSPDANPKKVRQLVFELKFCNLSSH